MRTANPAPAQIDDPRPMEDPDYLTRQLITCIGNKRALLEPIADAVQRVQQRIGRKRLRIFDAFSGSGVVSRFFKAHASLIIANDAEDYAAVASRCFLTNRSAVDQRALGAIIDELNAAADDVTDPGGFIEELYAPRDDEHITSADRVFYTRANARRLDNYRRMIDDVPPPMRDLLLGPLLSEASVHANTAGVFKGFYKNRRTGLGQFGGSGADALGRIKGAIRLEAPVLSRFACDSIVFREDATAAARRIEPVDLAYIDPPYNQHPYGSNYFMLNLLVGYERPRNISRVSGIPADWRRSDYNVRARSLPVLRELLEAVDAPFLLISFNDEGFISRQEMLELGRSLGTVEVIEVPYNAFRGSRNFTGRSVRVMERLFLVERH